MTWRTPLRRLGILLAAAVGWTWSTPARADLDLVFLLDTTGSMSGELNEAKDRVRQLAAALAEGRPGERVRIGVVAYRDQTDAYVTKTSTLSPDVDDSFKFLSGLSAGGGGDAPEDVLAGVKVAIEEMNWSQDPSVERQVFLIGDAPPHLDYQDHPSPEALFQRAVEQKIVFNTIGCRSLSRDGVAFFRELAYATEGRYQHIGRVRAGEAGLAEAMLDTLIDEQDQPDPGSPLGAFLAREAELPADHTLRAQGVEFISPITPCCSGPDSWGTIVAFYDPDGTIVELTEQPLMTLLYRVTSWLSGLFD